MILLNNGKSNVLGFPWPVSLVKHSNQLLRKRDSQQYHLPSTIFIASLSAYMVWRYSIFPCTIYDTGYHVSPAG